MVQSPVGKDPRGSYGFILMKLHSLKFVQGAVSKKDFVPSMTHFVIENGHVRAFNGILTISSPIEFDIACAPKGVPLVRAIAQCSDVVSLAITPANKLRIQSGPFKAFIDCVELLDLPHQVPEGVMIELDGKLLLTALETLVPFVGDDASRPWTNGVLFRNQSALATNNVCLVEYWLGVEFPFTCNVPLPAIKELLRVGEAPTHAQLSPHSVTFHYEDGRWIKTALFTTDWPDLTRILDTPSAPVPIPEGFFQGLEFLKNFTDDLETVYFGEGRMHTHRAEGVGATYDIAGLPSLGVFRRGMLAKLEGTATAVDFTLYPAPLLFYGDRLRGAIVGLRE